MFNLNKVNKWWMGPDDKVVNDGFDDLYNVASDYEIPPPSSHLRAELNSLKDDRKGMDSAMDKVFGSPNKPGKNSSIGSRPALQVVQNHTSLLNIVVVEPRSFEDSVEIVNHIKARKSVIVNLQYLDTDISQRVIDFVSGATFAMDGSQERVGTGVFIFASMNCTVETDSEGTKAYKDLFAKTFGI